MGSRVTELCVYGVMMKENDPSAQKSKMFLLYFIDKQVLLLTADLIENSLQSGALASHEIITGVFLLYSDSVLFLHR